MACVWQICKNEARSIWASSSVSSLSSISPRYIFTTSSCVTEPSGSTDEISSDSSSRLRSCDLSYSIWTYQPIHAHHITHICTLVRVECETNNIAKRFTSCALYHVRTKYRRSMLWGLISTHLIKISEARRKQLVNGLSCLSKHLQYLHQQVVDWNLSGDMVGDLCQDCNDHFLADVDTILYKCFAHRVAANNRLFQASDR